MKKRIISLALVIVMLLLTLCSCSFNYAKRDLTKYASFDSDEFVKALQHLVIADADFGTDEDARKIKVLDTIFKALATDAGTDNKITEGTLGKYDVLYYGYYITVEKDVPTGEKDESGKDITEKKTYTLMYDAMNPAKPGSVQFGLSDTEGLAKLIEELVGEKEIKDVYSAVTDGTTELGDKIYVSYTRTYSVPVYELDEDGNIVLDDEGNPTPELDAAGKPKFESKTETVNYGVVTLNDEPPATVTPAPSTPSTQADGEGEGDEGDNTDGETEPEVVKTFLANLVGQKVGKVSDYKVKETIDGEEYEVTYSSTQIHWIVESEGAELGTVEDKTYTTTKKVKDVNGVEVELKDETLVYHIFPMYIVDVAEELTPEIVLKKLYGTDSDKDGTVEDSEKGSLEILTSEDYKNAEETLKALAEKLVTAYNELAKADKALTTAKDKAAEEETEDESKDETTEGGDNTTEGGDNTTEGGDNTTDGGNDTTDEVTTTDAGTTDGENSTTEGEDEKEPTELEKAQATYDEKKAAVDELVTKILAATNGEKTVAEVLVTEYTDAVYDNLEASYKSTITSNLAKEVFKLAEKYITFNGKLPKRAVKDAYERIENTHKYNFYQGTASTSSGVASGTSNYSLYNGNYEAYLKVALSLKETDSMDTAKATMQAQAEAAVKELIIVYTLADYYGDAVELTKEQKKSVKNNIYVTYLGVAEEDLLHALQFDNVMNYILEEKAEEDYVEDAEYGENKVQYKHISYTFEEEKDDDADDSTTAGGDNTTEGGNDTTEGGDDTTDEGTGNEGADENE